MNQTIIYSNYKFDITVGQSQVHIKVFDTVTMNLYEGIVNENEIYVSPINKFAKLLVSALVQEKAFAIKIDKCPDKLKCQLQYKTDFIELEETFSLAQVPNTQAVEYHMRNKISTLESNDVQFEKLIGLLTDQVDKLTEQVAGLVKENQMLKEKIAEQEVVEVTCRPHLTAQSFIKYAPVNNVYLILYTSDLGVHPISPVPYASGFQNMYDGNVDLYLHFNFKRIQIYPSDQSSHSQQLNEFLDKYLAKTKKQIDEIMIRARNSYAYAYFDTLKKYSNYKKIKISVQDAHYNKLAFDAHCKANNIEIEYV